MTLARRAAAELDIDSLDELLLGPTGLAFSDGDPVTAAKALKDFSKDHEVFVIKGGLLGGEFLTPETISKLADIEPREVLLAKLAGAMKAPLVNMAGLLAALPRNSASMFQQLLEKKQADAPVATAEESTDAEEAPVEDAAADEAPDDAKASEDAPEAAPEAAAESDDPEETEDVSEAKVEASSDADASDDGDDETDDQAEASDDDAEEE
jgi:large subunit ribosomal protein L10